MLTARSAPACCRRCAAGGDQRRQRPSAVLFVVDVNGVSCGSRRIYAGAIPAPLTKSHPDAGLWLRKDLEQAGGS